jgi:cytoskeletal protein CcmA (bactofilin family)
MSGLGRTVLVRGEVRSAEDITIEGTVDGPVLCEQCSVVIAESATMTGPVLARDITVFGRADGQLVATDVVDLRAASHVTGRVVAPRFILNDGATFTGRVEPQHLEAAVRVARYEQKKRDEPVAAR